MMIPEFSKPTSAQIDYATDLIEKLGYDIDDYDFDAMTSADASELIQELKDELEG